MDLAQELTEACEANGWTRRELADKLGTTVETVSNWERGVVERPRRLDQIRTVLGLDCTPAALDDDALWRQFRETVDEIERRFYLR